MANNLVNQTGGPPGLPNREQVLARAAEAKPSQIEALHADLLALAQPASRRDIGEHLAILIGCFPNAKTDDTEIFGRMMAEFVAETNPSLSDVEAACHGLIKTMRFRPAIAEVLEALAWEKQHRLQWADRIKYFVEQDRQIKPPEPDRDRWQRNKNGQIARAKSMQMSRPQEIWRKEE